MTRISMLLLLSLTIASITVPTAKPPQTESVYAFAVVTPAPRAAAVKPQPSVSLPIKPVKPTPSAPVLDIDLAPELQAYTYKRCEALDIPYNVALAMMWLESRFQPDVVSADGEDFGLFQLRAKYTAGDLLDPHVNIDAALTLLSKYLAEQDGDVTRALMMYNCGPTGARRLWERGATETAYTRAVADKAAEFASGAPGGA